ncbi:hypothetical protein IW16_24690 [Chryseobacterium vrystaatense]|uniref:Serpentine receptor class gamma n=1 Tax=Chryseobacterium vrystaatense TaxID=307480 RepID=A0ABR4UG16_9FLAO|nr:hypothetical protein IW16_24690 [Chryseobacterium vrystaatense]
MDAIQITMTQIYTIGMNIPIVIYFFSNLLRPASKKLPFNFAVNIYCNTLATSIQTFFTFEIFLSFN